MTKEAREGVTPAVLLTGTGGGLGFFVMGFFYPWLWLGVPGCLFLGLLLGFLKKGCRYPDNQY